MKTILDISVWNDLTAKDYDFIAANFEGVILRVGYTGWGKPAKNKVIDDRFEKHYEALTARGVKLGGYWYGTDESPEESRIAAAKMLEILNGRKLVLGLFYDTEDTYYQVNMGKDLLTKTVLSFTNYLKERVSVPVGVYASYWFKDRLHFDKLKGLVIWEANYGVNNGMLTSKPMYDCHLHQFTSVRHFNGKNFDENVVMKKWWGNDVETSPTPKPEVKGEKAIIHPGSKARSKSSKYDGVQIASQYTGIELDYMLNQVAGENWVYFPKIMTYVDERNVTFVEGNKLKNRGYIRKGATARSLSAAYNGVSIHEAFIGKTMNIEMNKVAGKNWVYFPEIQTYVEESDVVFV